MCYNVHVNGGEVIGDKGQQKYSPIQECQVYDEEKILVSKSLPLVKTWQIQAQKMRL